MRLPAQDRPIDAATFAAVADALKSSRNLAVTMAVVDRLAEFERAHASQTFTPAFIANVPAIVAR